MAEMSPIERVQAVLSGRPADRPPVGFWCHFPPDACFGPAAVDVHLRHLDRFQLDFVKVMNDNGYPLSKRVRTVADLRSLPVLRGDETEFKRQLELVRELKSQLADRVYLTTTVFNAWSVLRKIVDPLPSAHHGPPALNGGPAAADRRITELLREDRSAVAMAVDAIAASLANFARRCIEAGADGIFFSVRDDWVDTDENGPDTYDEIVRTGDGQVLSTVRGARFNILHVCGRAVNFEAFAAYPVQVINWADRAVGPAIRNVVRALRPVVCGGVDNLRTLPHGTTEDVRREVQDALDQADGRPLIVSPGCTYDPQLVADDNLFAMTAAARSAARRTVTQGSH